MKNAAYLPSRGTEAPWRLQLNAQQLLASVRSLSWLLFNTLVKENTVCTSGIQNLLLLTQRSGSCSSWRCGSSIVLCERGGEVGRFHRGWRECEPHSQPASSAQRNRPKEDRRPAPRSPELSSCVRHQRLLQSHTESDAVCTEMGIKHKVKHTQN